MLERKVRYIIAFYFLYFSWLLTIIFISPRVIILNYFTALVTLVYFLTIRESDDFWWFAGGFLISVVLTIISFSGFRIKYEPSNVKFLAPWLPVAWGTTFVSLRKIYLILTKF